MIRNDKLKQREKLQVKSLHTNIMNKLQTEAMA